MKCNIMLHFIWVFTVCQCTKCIRLGFSSIQRFKYRFKVYILYPSNWDNYGSEYEKNYLFHPKWRESTDFLWNFSNLATRFFSHTANFNEFWQKNEQGLTLFGVFEIIWMYKWDHSNEPSLSNGSKMNWTKLLSDTENPLLLYVGNWNQVLSAFMVKRNLTLTYAQISLLGHEPRDMSTILSTFLSYYCYLNCIIQI